MRHAVEQHLNPAPEIPDEPHPYDGAGCVIAHVGSLSVFMRLDRPGEYFTDLACKQPASDDQARAAFGEGFARYRKLGQLEAENQRIEAALQPQPEPEVTAKDDLKSKTRRLVREYEKRVQAQADLAITRDLGPPPTA
jgi:hypothetical protein